MTKYSTDSPIPKIVKKILPAVISIAVSKMMPVFETPFGPTPFGFDGQFMIPKGKKKIQVGGGSGFIIDKSGIVLTNRHVVSDTEAEYMVVINEEEKYPAHVLARDPINDIAILKARKDNLPSMELGDSSGLE